MPKRNRIKPSYLDEESDDELNYTLDNRKRRDLHSSEEEEDDDEMSKISFGALNKAQSKLQQQQRHQQDEDSEDEFFDDSDSDSGPEETSSSNNSNKKRSKHAPTISSTKKPVSRVRDIPGLPSRRSQTLHTDIRFDAAYGKADIQKARKNYAFLDEYRKQEISNMENILKDRKSKLTEYEKQEIQNQLQSLKSRMDTLKNKDLETSILKEYKQKQFQQVKDGKTLQPYFLKRGDKRKILQKAKYDSMKPKQREKAMERKRKKRLGKEFRQLEFRTNNR
ncbi:RRP36 [Candida jiufengensis]|uniref:RRP36 n=1 Tax=Candida jiufengensis TaxID=497108 RepID=UPI0022259723|nr:RRP36 [Candida jiufengensis]KAI5954445.1 RRP36 [Candida jiufengensis]